MKKSITLLLLFAFILTAYGQNESPLKYTYDERNVVSNTIDGTWKRVDKDVEITYKKDISVLNLIPAKLYGKLKGLTIYHAGFMTIIQKGDNKGKYPFLITTKHGNPHFIFFREGNGSLYGNSESSNIVIIKGETSAQDRLFNDHGRYYEFVRVK